MRLRFDNWIMAVVIATSFAARRAEAVIIASDDASDAVYADGWAFEQDTPPLVGDNGGSGFGPWRGLSEGPPNYGGGALEIDTVPQSENDLGGPAFRVGNGFSGYFMSRPFANPLEVGQSFSIDFDTFPIFPDGGQILISLGHEDGINTPDEEDARVAFYAYYYNDGSFTFGSDNWGINAASANDNLNGGASLPADPLGGIDWQTNYTTTDASDGFTLTVDVVTTDTYRLRVADDGVTKLDISGTMIAATTGELINQVSFFGDVVTDSSFEQDTYFNNLKIESPGQPGDFNGDGMVNIRDYNLWRNNLGAGDESAIMDNGDGMNGVDIADYQLWVSEFGNPGAAGGALAASGIPEPNTGFLAAGAVVAFLGWRIRRR